MNGKVAVAQRGAIVSGIRAGRTNSEIAGFNSIPISTVKKISKLYNDFLASVEGWRRTSTYRGRPTGAAVTT